MREFLSKRLDAAFPGERVSGEIEKAINDKDVWKLLGLFNDPRIAHLDHVQQTEFKKRIIYASVDILEERHPSRVKSQFTEIEKLDVRQLFLESIKIDVGVGDTDRLFSRVLDDIKDNLFQHDKFPDWVWIRELHHDICVAITSRTTPLYTPQPILEKHRATLEAIEGECLLKSGPFLGVGLHGYFFPEFPTASKDNLQPLFIKLATSSGGPLAHPLLADYHIEDLMDKGKNESRFPLVYYLNAALIEKDRNKDKALKIIQEGLDKQIDLTQNWFFKGNLWPREHIGASVELILDGLILATQIDPDAKIYTSVVEKINKISSAIHHQYNKYPPEPINWKHNDRIFNKAIYFDLWLEIHPRVDPFGSLHHIFHNKIIDDLLSLTPTIGSFRFQQLKDQITAKYFPKKVIPPLPQAPICFINGIPMSAPPAILSKKPDIDQTSQPNVKVGDHLEMTDGSSFEVEEVFKGGQSIVCICRNPFWDRREILREKLDPNEKMKHIHSTKKMAEIKRHLQKTNPMLARMIPELYGIFTTTDKQHQYVSLEYIEGKSLEQLLEEGTKFSEEQIKKIGFNLARFLQYLHEREKLAFKDLKPKNIILSPDGQRLALVDWDLLSPFGSDFEKLGTPEYASPERLAGSVLPIADTYSLGITLYQLLTGELQDKINLAGIKIEERLPKLKGLPPFWQDLIINCTKEDPSSRWTATQVLERLKSMVSR